MDTCFRDPEADEKEVYRAEHQQVDVSNPPILLTRSSLMATPNFRWARSVGEWNMSENGERWYWLSHPPTDKYTHTHTQMLGMSLFFMGRWLTCPPKSLWWDWCFLLVFICWLLWKGVVKSRETEPRQQWQRNHLSFPRSLHPSVVILSSYCTLKFVLAFQFFNWSLLTFISIQIVVDKIIKCLIEGEKKELDCFFVTENCSNRDLLNITHSL